MLYAREIYTNFFQKLMDPFNLFSLMDTQEYIRARETFFTILLCIVSYTNNILQKRSF
jgi:hypothetical protein